MGKYQRNKGANFERWVARELGGKRGFQTRGGTTEAPDVLVERSGGGWWAVECKVGAAPNLRAALVQGERFRGPESTALAVCKWDFDEPIVAMRFSTFKELLALLQKDNDQMGIP